MCTKCKMLYCFKTAIALTAGGAACVLTFIAAGKSLGIIDVAKKVEEKVEEK